MKRSGGQLQTTLLDSVRETRRMRDSKLKRTFFATLDFTVQLSLRNRQRCKVSLADSRRADYDCPASIVFLGKVLSQYSGSRRANIGENKMPTSSDVIIAEKRKELMNLMDTTPFKGGLQSEMQSRLEIRASKTGVGETSLGVSNG